MTAQLDKIAYTARATATGGRGGSARTDDGVLDVDLAPPTEMGGPGGAVNPEQLFAAGYAACFQSALALVCRRRGLSTAASVVSAEVSIGPVGDAFGLAVVLVVDLEGADQAEAEKLAAAADAVCPYSSAIRGNVPVEIRVTGRG
ncbi:organic hydroperoxide resistance protein [Janibacter melonis]|uniref:organic hydroperoxide resistance protein n=1 Tax=Janibacter melonis TaxID=262209 RepID=UPI00177DE177|nr:organic hydroperoxide resistance protein [Janibacter melonis]